MISCMQFTMPELKFKYSIILYFKRRIRYFQDQAKESSCKWNWNLCELTVIVVKVWTSGKIFILAILELTQQSQNHKMAWIGREPRDHQVPVPLPHAGYQLCQSKYQNRWPRAPFSLAHGQDIHSLSGHPVPAPHCSLYKKLHKCKFWNMY